MVPPPPTNVIKCPSFWFLVWFSPLSSEASGVKCKRSRLANFIIWEHLECITVVVLRLSWGTKKVKYTLIQALRLFEGRTNHRGNRGIALLFLDHGTRRGWGVSVTPGQLLAPGKTRYPLYRRLGGPQGRSGEVRKFSPPPGLRSPDRPVRSQSLFRLSYTAHLSWGYKINFCPTSPLWGSHINPLNADLTLFLLTWKLWWAPNNANRWQMGFNSAFKGLNPVCHLLALSGAHHIFHVSGLRVKFKRYVANYLYHFKWKLQVLTSSLLYDEHQLRFGCLDRFSVLFNLGSHCEEGAAPSSCLRNLFSGMNITWRVWWAPNNASRWQMGFNLAFKVLWYMKHKIKICTSTFSHGRNAVAQWL